MLPNEKPVMIEVEEENTRTLRRLPIFVSMVSGAEVVVNNTTEIIVHLYIGGFPNKVVLSQSCEDAVLKLLGLRKVGSAVDPASVALLTQEEYDVMMSADATEDEADTMARALEETLGPIVYDKDEPPARWTGGASYTHFA